jgi:hypothetical protein
MASYIIPIARISKKVKKLSALYLIIGCLTVAKQVVSFGVTTLATRTRRTLTSTASHQKPRIISLGFSSIPSPLLLAKPSDEENAGYKNNEKQWDDEESLLVMNLSPLPNVSCEDTLSRISQYIRSFPFAAVLPVQPLQALPTDDGGLELKFLRKKTNFKPGVDGGVRFFVKVRDDGENDSIEVILKRNSEGQSIPKMFAEKLIVQSFVKGMALGSDSGNDNNGNEPSPVKVPNTRIESPTKDMAKIQSIFHKWI